MSPLISCDELSTLLTHRPSPTVVIDCSFDLAETRQLALDLGFITVVPPLRTRLEPWEYNREMCKRRNEVEHLFRRLKGYRRIFSRFEKLDVMFIA